MRVGSRPISMGLKSSMHPTTARVFHSSVASPQPCRPGTSVCTFTKTQLRMRALTTTVLMSIIFMGQKYLFLCADIFQHARFGCADASNNELALEQLTQMPVKSIDKFQIRRPRPFPQNWPRRSTEFTERMRCGQPLEQHSVRTLDKVAGLATKFRDFGISFHRPVATDISRDR